jgi:hypothetical protein
MNAKFLSAFAVSVFMIGACSKPAPAGPVKLFPDAEKPDHRTPSYSLTESPDGMIRIFTKENGDEAWLYEMHRTGQSWSEPERMELPARMRLKGASFNRQDGSLYFATDAVMPPPFKGKDLNIWRVERLGDSWGEAKPLEGEINTGADETIASVAEDGTMIFVSNRPEMDGFGYGLGEAHQDESGAWKITKFLTDLNDIRTDDHAVITADGNRLFFYSHRTPKAGGADIWTSTRQADGTWSKPANPGAPLNSESNEFGPGLSGDNQTLFFARDGELMEIPMDEVLNGTPIQ